MQRLTVFADLIVVLFVGWLAVLMVLKLRGRKK